MIHRKTHLAVIGAGLIGQKHVALIANSNAAQLVGICDPDASRKSIAEQFQTPFFQSIEELFVQTKPDGVIIATPNHAHASVAEICAAHGVHMLVEKPIAETIADAERVIQAANAANVRVLVGHHRRYNPLIGETRKLIQSGTIGRLIAVNVLFTIRKPDDYFQVEWRTQRPSGGPALINLIHDVDSLRFICGEIVQVYAQSSSAVRNLAVEDSLVATLTFASGALGTVLLSDAAAAPWSYEATTGENSSYFRTSEDCYHFVGTEGSLAFPSMRLWRYSSTERVGWQHPLVANQHNVQAADPLVRQLEHFCRVIRGEEAPFVSAIDGTRSLAAIQALLESAQRNHAVIVDTTDM